MIRTRRLAVAASTLLVLGLLAACDGHGGDGHSGDGGHGPAASVPADAAFSAADVAFATDMIPHHRQAVEMAQLAEPRATDPRVRALAARIRQAQDPEIATMSGWLREWGRPVPSGSPGAGHDQHAGMPGMMSGQEMRDLTAAAGTTFDRMFLQMMIRHHQGAIDMCGRDLGQRRHPGARTLSGKIAADQAAEVKEMQELLAGL